MIIAPCETVRTAEQAAFAAGRTTPEALTLAVVERLESALRAYIPWQGTAVVYAGKGNNAMDAVGLAVRMASRVMLRAVAGADIARLQAMAASVGGGELCLAETPPEPQAGLLLIDGLLGSGARGELRAEYAALSAEMNDLRARSEGSLALAVDIPTGLNADTGAVPPSAVRADITCPIGCVKPGLLADGAEEAVGCLLPVDLPGIPLTPSTTDRVLTAEESLVHLPRRANSCFKNRAGRVAIVAGSVGMLGAAQLCAEAALAAGAGLVVLYCHADTYPLLAVRVAPEIMVQPVTSYAEIQEPNAQALIIGPGLGSLPAGETAALRRLAQSFCGTVVLDADGFRLTQEPEWTFTPNMILTPHPGEMRRLDPRPATTRRETVRRFLAEHDVTLLLKGARTLIAQGEACWYNSTGGPHMANGGQGDALSGVIGALAAQGCGPLHAAAAGAFLCGRAAERARLARRAQLGRLADVVTASQLIPYLR